MTTATFIRDTSARYWRETEWSLDRPVTKDGKQVSRVLVRTSIVYFPGDGSGGASILPGCGRAQGYELAQASIHDADDPAVILGDVIAGRQFRTLNHRQAIEAMGWTAVVPEGIEKPLDIESAIPA